MIDNQIIILILVCLLIFYYNCNSTDKFENTKECYDKALNNAIYKYNVNTINRGSR
jgi:hypothetical protein